MKSDHSQWCNSTKLFLIAIVVLTLVGTVSGAGVLSASGQAFYRWSYPQRIPNYDDHSRPPFLVPDQARTLHVFNYELSEGQQSAIFYRRWSSDQGWTVPVDILLITQGIGGQVIQGAWLDSSGFIHLVYYDDSTIRYSRALAVDAHDARAWSSPIVIGEAAGPLASADFIGDDNGRFTVVYCGRGEGVGIYEVHSTDAGITWSDPVVVSLVYNSEQWPLGIRMLRDSRGYIHLLWTNVNTLLGLGEEIRYSRLESEDLEWTTPVVLVRRDTGDYSAHWPALIDFQDELILVYQDGFPPTKWMRRSQDAGRSWTLPIRLFPHEGEYEYPVLVKDGSGNLHMLLGNRIGYPSTHGMWHSQLINGSWSNPEPLISGPKTPEFDPSAPKAAFLQGNILMVTWWNDTDYENRNGAWYSYTTLNIPELPLVPLPTATYTSPPPTEEAQAIPSFTGSPTPLPAWVKEANEQGLSAEIVSLSRLFVVGATPVIMLILLVLVLSHFVFRTRQTR